MKKLLIVLLAAITLQSCSTEEQTSPQKSNKTDHNQVKVVTTPVFRVDSVTRITITHPEFLKLAATPEFQASLDPGNDTSWYKVHTNLKGLVVLVSRATELLGNDHGGIEWLMDTLNSSNSATIVMGIRYLYSQNSSTTTGYTGKETIYAPFSNEVIIEKSFDKDVFVSLIGNSTITPEHPLRVWKDNDECMYYTTLRMEQYEKYTGNPAGLAARVSCFADILLGLDAVDMCGLLLP